MGGAFSYRPVLRAVAIALGLTESWVTRHEMGADGIAYLDMGDAYWRGDWHMAINAHWSPLYSWLLGFATKILKPSPYWEFPVVHLVNFAIYLGALVSFEFLLRAVIAYHWREAPTTDGRISSLPEWAWYAIGYTIFLWSSFELMSPRAATPDMCVATFFYLASGLVLKIRQGRTTWGTFVGLGVVLGIGYLAKAIMFPLAFVFLAVALCSTGWLRKAMPRTLAATAVFLAIGAPLFVALSISAGRLTFGESGRLNYIWTVNRSDLGAVKHPMERIYDRPVIYKFASPIPGTYPPWYDPAYWTEGLKAHFDLKNQLRVLKLTSLNYYRLLLLSDAGLVAVVIMLFSMTPLGAKSSCKSVCQHWHLLIPALVGLGAFFLLIVDGRYVAPFALLLWLGILSGLRLPSSEQSHKLLVSAVLAIMITVGVPVIASIILDWSEARHTGPVDWQIAQSLHQVGIQPGDKVAFIRRSPAGDFFWARLAKIQIIAEVPPSDADEFWATTPSVRTDIFDALAKTGAKAIIASEKPPGATGAAWQRLGATDNYAHLLRPAESSAEQASARTSLHP